jgi:hypothetical protein
MGAIFSHCGTWRYWLDRQIDMLGGPVYLFAGVNPSKADADLDDPTVRKWRGFVTRAGGSGFIAVNPFAFCATEVKELAKAADPIGPDNDRAIVAAIAQADILVPCWGSLDKLPKTLWPRVAAVRDMLLASGKPIKVFGLTASGDPKHPLMLGYAGGMVDWDVCRPPAPAANLRGVGAADERFRDSVEASIDAGARLTDHRFKV